MRSWRWGINQEPRTRKRGPRYLLALDIQVVEVGWPGHTEILLFGSHIWHNTPSMRHLRNIDCIIGRVFPRFGDAVVSKLSGSPATPTEHSFSAHGLRPSILTNRFVRSRACYLVFVLFMVEQAIAQDKVPKVEWFIEGGGSFLKLGPQKELVSFSPASLPAEKATFVSPNHFSSGGIETTGFRYYVGPNSALEASYSQRINYFLVRDTSTANTGLWGIESFNGSFDYVRYLPEPGRLRPFAVAGLGLTVSDSVIPGIERHNVAGNFGLGTDIRLNQRLALRLEVRDYVAHLPRPLRGIGHDLTASMGLVVRLRDSPKSRGAFPRFEFFVEGGTSFLTDGSIRQVLTVQDQNGQVVNVPSFTANSFSTAGRVFAGVRYLMTRNNALELSFSYSPNRYELSGGTNPPVVTFNRDQRTQWLNVVPLNFVRYLRVPAGARPFVTGGVGTLRFAGIFRDIDKFSWNFGLGIDFPVHERIALRFEFRDFMAGQPELVGGVTHNLAPTAGLVFRFY